jgi:hypothetical protein
MNSISLVWSTQKSRGVPGRIVRSEENNVRSEEINQSNHLKE